MNLASYLILFIFLLTLPITFLESKRESNAKISKTNFSILHLNFIENSQEKKCEYKDIPLYGKVKFVESFGDIKIQFVKSFPDIKVKFVTSFPNDCGKWQVVESFPDFTVQIVESFPDIKVEAVESFPGIN